MSLTLSNPTDRELYAPQVQGEDYHLEPGESMTTNDNRLALLLAEYGFVMSAQDRESAIRGDDHPSVQPRTDDEARFTGGRHHRADDARVNVPGTPVEVTGDTGALTNEKAVENGGDLPTVDTPGVPVVEHEAPSRTRRRRTAKVVEPEAEDASIEDGTDLTVKVTPQALDAEDAPPAPPSELAAAAAAAATTAASAATLAAVEAGAASTPPSDAPGEQESSPVASSGSSPADATGQAQPSRDAGTVQQAPAQDSGSVDLAWIDGLRGAALDDAMREQSLDPAGKNADTKRAELRAAFSA